MDKLFLLAGIAGSVGGVCLMIYQGLMYLMHNTWNQYTVLFLIDHGPTLIREQVHMSPGISAALQGCPLFVFLIVLGLILLFIGSRLSQRYL